MAQKPVLIFITAFLTVLLGKTAASAESVNAEIARLLPKKVGTFQQLGGIRSSQGLLNEISADVGQPASTKSAKDGYFGSEVDYKADNGKLLLVELARLRTDADAYSMLTLIARGIRKAGRIEQGLLEQKIGTANVRSQHSIAFFKGTAVIRVTSTDSTGLAEAVDLAQALAENVDRGDGEIPVLVMHLPDWQNAQQRVLFLTKFRALQPVANHPVLAAIESPGDADAVVAEYGQATLVMVEFNTPQLAADNDRLVRAKIQELQSQNQSIPTSYRRVGNYGVFVFNGSSEQAANELINQIKYEQVVQWLGDNPYWFKEAQRRYTETTLGVLVAVVKASGLTLLGCFGLGGLIGGVMFARRRKRQTSLEAFSDAGGMLRLNLDDMTPQTDSARLLPGRN